MAVAPVEAEEAAKRARLPRKAARPLQREGVLAYLFMIPGWAILLAFMAYPFFLGIYISLTDRLIGFPDYEFIGLDNYRFLLDDPVFIQTVKNTIVYGVFTVPFKLVLGLWLALLLNRTFRFSRLLRAGLLLPWIVPTALSTLAWLMLFNGVLSPISWVLTDWGVIDDNINFLGEAWNARISLSVANIWRGTPFFAITILAGLQAVPHELNEAAALDGATRFQRFFSVTLPVIRDIILIATLFSVIWTIADFQLVYVLTHGGPANETHVFGTYAYNVGLGGFGDLGQAAAISLYMFPALAVISIILLRYVRRED